MASCNWTKVQMTSYSGIWERDGRGNGRCNRNMRWRMGYLEIYAITCKAWFTRHMSCLQARKSRLVVSVARVPWSNPWSDQSWRSWQLTSSLRANIRFVSNILFHLQTDSKYWTKTHRSERVYSPSLQSLPSRISHSRCATLLLRLASVAATSFSAPLVATSTKLIYF